MRLLAGFLVAGFVVFVGGCTSRVDLGDVDGGDGGGGGGGGPTVGNSGGSGSGPSIGPTPSGGSGGSNSAGSGPSSGGSSAEPTEAGVPTVSSFACTNILDYLADCDTGELDECNREDALLGPSSRSAVGAYSTCALSNPLGGCTASSGRWGHGPCQSEQASTNAAVDADPLLSGLRCILSADTSSGTVVPNGCHRSDGTTFSCPAGSPADYGRCCVQPGETACFFSDFTVLNLHFY